VKVERKHQIGVGLLVIVSSLVLAWMALQVGALSNLGERVEVTAVLDDAAGLTTGAAVSIAGVEVGRVDGLRVDYDQAVVSLSLHPEAEVREDVLVLLRARSLLGEKYIELVPQSRDAAIVQSGAVLTNTHGQVEIDQFVTGLEPLIRSMDPEATLKNLREASEDAPELVAETRQTLADVRRVSRKAELVADRADRVLGEIEAAAEPLPEATQRLPGLLDEAEATLIAAKEATAVLSDNSERIETILENFEQIDTWELRRLLREEGIVVRFRPSEVEPTE
jgi:phospholipid/cholesterol/gamma-HCH transport system substrate-binding protein